LAKEDKVSKGKKVFGCGEGEKEERRGGEECGQ
jgi:hypothetical protein